MPLLKNKNLWTTAFYLWIAAIILLTVISFSPEMKKQNEGGFRFDYLEHFFVFAIIPLLYHLARGEYLDRFLRSKWAVFALGLVFCALAELQQNFIPGRNYNPVDLVLNILGYLTGSFAVWLFIKEKMRKEKA